MNGTDQSIILRKIEREDFERVVRWSQDHDFCTANGWQVNSSREKIYEWINHWTKHTPSSFIRLGIEWNKKLIGYGDLVKNDGNSVEVGIAIGERTLWGKGIGYVAMKCLMNYALEHLGANVFHAETHDKNYRSRKLLEKLEYQEISRIGVETYLGEESQLIQYQFVLGRNC